MKAFNDMILLEVDETPVATPQGIELPESTSKTWLGPIAKVLDIGPKAKEEVQPPIKKGDWVMIDPRYVTNTIVKGLPYKYIRPVGLVSKLSQIEINAEIVEIQQKVEPMIVTATAGESLQDLKKVN